MAIAANERAAAIYGGRIALLQGEVAALERAKLEQKRTEVVAAIEKKLAHREATAIKLEAAIAEFGRLYFALADAPPITSEDWPFKAPFSNFGRVNLPTIRRETSWALFSAGRPTEGRSHLPPATGEGLGVTGIHAVGLANVVAAQSAN